MSITKRLDWVDGLKGISAIIVVLQHTLVTIFGVCIYKVCGSEIEWGCG